MASLGRLLGNLLGIHAQGDEPRKRRKAPAPDDDWWYQVPGTRASSGVPVNPDTALAVAAVFGCIRVIAETLATLPVKFYRRLPDGEREPADDHPIATLFNQRANKLMDPMGFLELLTAHAALRGTGYALKQPGPITGYADELIPLDPNRMLVQRVIVPGEKVPVVRYRYTWPGNNEAVTYSRDRIFRVPGLSFDGIEGASVLRHARETIGLALATEGFGARVFSQAALHAGVLEHPGTLGDEAAKNLQRSWQRMHAGLANAHTVAVLEEGMKWHQVGMTSEDAQFLATRKFQVTEICRWFRVPPHLVFDLERSTNNNIEHQGIEFVKFTMLPWARRWEWAIKRDLLPTVDEGGEDVYPEFLFDALERADLATRYEAYSKGIAGGFLAPNEPRRKENLPPKRGGDELRVQPGTTAASDGIPGAGAPPDGGGPAGGDPDPDEGDEGSGAEARAGAAPRKAPAPPPRIPAAAGAGGHNGNGHHRG